MTWDARAEPASGVLREADVVLEGFRPGVCERLGVELRDTTILCSITGFGADGPHASQAGHDLNYLGYAGVLADTAPAVPPVQIADLAAGGQGAVIEVLAALLERTRTGRGARIVISMTHGSHRFVAHRAGGDPVPRLLTGGVACYRIYETADGRYLTVAALEPKFWRRLCELLELPDLVDRAFEPELPELTSLLPHPHDARVARPARRRGHLRRAGPRRSRKRRLSAERGQETPLRVPRCEREHARCAGGDHERLCGDPERDRLLGVHAGGDEDRGARAGLHRSSRRRDRQHGRR